MGLAERKDKQRIGHDPRNLTWSDDKNRFSYKHMSSLGWSEKSGIGGSDLSGNPNHITVARKLDNGGIGVGRARKEGDDAASGAGMAGVGLDAILKRLAEASRSGTTTPTEEVAVEVKTETVPARNRIASRQKHLTSKRLASQSPAALAEILGVSVASLTPTPTPSELSTPVPEIPNDPRTAEETTSTSTVSVADYFRQKLREKAMARHVASGGSTELPEHSLARVKEEVKVDVGGVKWEGSRVTFGESQVDEDVKPDIKPDVKPTLAELAAVDTEAEDIKPSKEERRRAKEEKRKLKEEKRARKAAGQDTGSEVVIKEEILVKTEPIEPPKAKKEKRKRESGAEGSKEKREKHSA